MLAPITASLSNSLKFIKKSLQTLFSSCSHTQTAAAPYRRIPKSHPCNTQISTHRPETSCSMISNPRTMKNGFERDCREPITGERLVVAAKLKELVTMDRSDADLVLDIEEVLHYYSRLRCPVYLDLFHKFFMELCAEFAAAGSTPRSGPDKAVVGRSRPRCRTIGR